MKGLRKKCSGGSRICLYSCDWVVARDWLRCLTLHCLMRCAMSPATLSPVFREHMRNHGLLELQLDPWCPYSPAIPVPGTLVRRSTTHSSMMRGLLRTSSPAGPSPKPPATAYGNVSSRRKLHHLWQWQPSVLENLLGQCASQGSLQGQNGQNEH